jgi:hypothetical protein
VFSRKLLRLLEMSRQVEILPLHVLSTAVQNPCKQITFVKSFLFSESRMKATIHLPIKNLKITSIIIVLFTEWC